MGTPTITSTRSTSTSLSTNNDEYNKTNNDNLSKPSSHWRQHQPQDLLLTTLTTLSSLRHRIPFHLYSLWLFTYTDLKTIVFPETCFGLLTALSQVQVDQQQQHQKDEQGESSSATKTSLQILLRTPLILLWVYSTLLPFAINNQSCTRLAIEEDRLNKPWRTMPSGRWTVKQAKGAMIFFYAFSMALSFLPLPFPLGLNGHGFRSNLAMLGLGIWYNQLGGADSHPLTRNLINAFGFTAFGTGALELALDRRLEFASAFFSLSSFGGPFKENGNGNGLPSLEHWLLTIASVVLTTVHTQDMYDQEGDRERGRNTVPLYYGDTEARWSVVGFMGLWGIVLPLLWGCGLLGWLLCSGLAFTVAFRCWAFRGVREDKVTFRVWNLWMVVLYGLPLIRRF